MEKKMNNKGFSLVELIIVIAIMAILAGALAPALIKYVAKSRRSSDVSNAQTVATAIQGALSDEDALDAANTNSYADGNVHLLSTLDGATDDFATTVNQNISGGIKSVNKIKSKKDKAGNTITSTDGFSFTVDVTTNKACVYITGTPSTGAKATANTKANYIEVYPDVDEVMGK